MLKRLAILGGIALIVAVILVAGYHQNRYASSQGYDIKCVQPSDPPSDAATLTCEIKPSQNADQGKPNTRWGYALITWPEGITAWLLLLTLGAITWQGWATVRSAKATEDSNRQSADFFKAEKRPWIGILGNLSLRDKRSTKPGHHGFTVEYVIKNFGVAPAFNTVVPFGTTVEGLNMNNYALVKSKVDEARKSGENIVTMTGDLLLPGEEKTGTCEFSEAKRANKFVITGCIVYRFADGTVHHTELSYWIDLNEGARAEFRTLWFQAAD